MSPDKYKIPRLKKITCSTTTPLSHRRLVEPPPVFWCQSASVNAVRLIPVAMDGWLYTVYQVGSAKFVSRFDLVKGVVTLYGLYLYEVMPLSLRNAPATSQHLMNQVVPGLEGCYLQWHMALSSLACPSAVWVVGWGHGNCDIPGTCSGARTCGSCQGQGYNSS